MRKSFGRKLQQLRKGAGLSQADLAAKANVSVDSLRHWEQGQVLPRIDAATKLARALGVSLDLLAVEVDASELQPAKKRKEKK
jgi:transcriptional regulator with XRE-family HTH domain